ncbi:hypothetical protein CO174_01140 [Candidatus Uhrbacteria bacterium CG_4_9_14_3_um_filter_50_9]|uniref:Uncharacterized protein n=1 Tax=Candidatus Uhrbacteria bacterium CG_4_9_14_3_um_filter_50_9 TaxID=1975035 RepID=A0A2M7XDV0_9BACT|nr:MAG: hypothetical protein CO174_01140 [Candidatus Uhrbacteria bacterium CG_4_9_14_3_um_filter_50_9]
MNFKTFLIIMGVASAVAWIAWLVVVNAIDPTRSGLLGFILFYGSLASALLGTLSVAGVLIRIWLKKDEILVRMSARSFRQALLLTVLFIGGLVLSGLGLLRWWTLVLFILIVSIFEMIFLSLKKK